MGSRQTSNIKTNSSRHPAFGLFQWRMVMRGEKFQIYFGELER
jgi:hypothetical protein